MAAHNYSRKKKLAIVGRGTAGCLSFLHYNHFNGKEHDVEIEWLYDSNIPTTPVGEGTDMRIPIQLGEKAGFNTQNLADIGGTTKLGIQKEDWGGSGSFLNPFPIGATGIHMDASELQKWIFSQFGHRVKTKDINVSSPDEVDADYVMMATGTPKEMPEEDFYHSPYIPVNAAYVTQCQWPQGIPTFFATLAVARPWGWVFGIPLMGRCSIGYIYNKDITKLETIKEDVQEVFERYSLTPTNKTNSIHFKNYFRKAPISSRVSHNGNACFFLEPLEATSLSSAYLIDIYTWRHWFNGEPLEDQNNMFYWKMKQIEAIICTHYMSGSKYKNEFWDMAQAKGEAKMHEVYKDSAHQKWLKAAIQDPKSLSRDTEFGTWDRGIWHINTHGLGVADKMLNMQ
jgi:hypothetical protein